MKRRGGFTLVELLIVIMIIGILAGMVLLAMGPVLDSVRASAVISDTRTLLSAAQLFLVDDMKVPENNATDIARLKELMNKDLFTADSRYVNIVFASKAAAGDDPGNYYVGLQLKPGNEGIQKSLSGKKAIEVGGVGAGAGGTGTLVDPYGGEISFLLPLNQTPPAAVTPPPGP